MAASSTNPQVVHRTARICLRTTPAQASRDIGAIQAKLHSDVRGAAT